MLEFIKNDSHQIFKEMISTAEQAAGETLLPGDERYLFLQQMVPVIVALKASINDTGNQNLLRYARDKVLDAYGEDRDVQRLPAAYASVTLRFSIPLALGFYVAIPAGTRITPDGILNFLVDTEAIITAGKTYVDVTATAEYAGVLYNNFQAGQISSIVDPIKNVSTVANITTSTDGADKEDDEGYRARIILSPEMIPTTGCEEAYIGWAKTASSSIEDVAVTADNKGNVTLHILTQEAASPSAALIKQVEDAVSAKKRRPLTDHVTVVGATQKNYSITFTYYISKTNSADEMKIEAAVPNAVDSYKLATQSHLGGCINPDDLRKLLLSAGAYRIDLLAPTFTRLTDNEVAICTATSVTYGGLLE